MLGFFSVSLNLAHESNQEFVRVQRNMPRVCMCVCVDADCIE